MARAMSQAPQIEIVTIYNAARTSGARSRIRALSLISLVVAGVWLWAVHFEVDPWLGEKLIVASLNEAFSLLPANASTAAKTVTPAERAKLKSQLNDRLKAGGRRQTILCVEMYVWLGIAYLAGGWLALSSVVGVVGRRVSLRMQRQAALLMILSTAASIAGIWVAIKWGGMPPHADLELYAKVGGAQSGYAWFLMIATRLVR